MLYLLYLRTKEPDNKIADIYKEKLLDLPEFLINHNISATKESLKQAIKLTGFFINKFLKKNNKKLPFYRKNILI